VAALSRPYDGDVKPNRRHTSARGGPSRVLAWRQDAFDAASEVLCVKTKLTNQANRVMGGIDVVTIIAVFVTG
jgi:hypothetical protein